VSTRRRRGLTIVAAGSLALVASQVALRASAAPAPVQPGTAAADAAVVGVVPQASSLSLTTSAGQSEAAYNQTEDQATSGTVDLGGLGVLMANSPVCGKVFFTEQRQPQPLTADSQDGSRTLTSDNGGNEPGHESVTVSSSPEYAEATTAPVQESIPSVMQVSGESTTEVRYVAATEQVATAAVEADVSFLNGLVTMKGLHWDASRQMGTKNTSSTSFTVGSVTVARAGVPVTLPSSASSASAFAAVNRVLSVFGITVSPPVTSSDDNTGTLSMTPIDVHFSGSPTDNKALGPVAAELPPLESLIASQTSDGSDCSQVKNLLGNLLTPSEEVFNVVLSGAQGAGGLDVDLGGATVSVEAAPNYANPFDIAGGGGSAPLIAPPAHLSGGGPVTIPAQPAQETATAPTPPLTASRSTPPPSSSEPATLVRCVTTSPAGTPRCWSGLGVVAGAAVVAIGVALFLADLAVAQGLIRRRRPPSNPSPSS
jgi:hypothetical protein